MRSRPRHPARYSATPRAHRYAILPLGIGHSPWGKIRVEAGNSSLVPLVGRERELDTLRVQLAELFAGRGSLVLIGADAGVGKTALVEAIGREAIAAGADVAVGHCY